jgi:hypothetical protein
VAKKCKAVFPSGLARNWETKAKNSTRNDSGAAGTRKKSLQSSTSASSLELGGLADDDAFATAPPVDPSEKTRYTKRVNEVCSNILVVYCSGNTNQHELVH